MKRIEDNLRDLWDNIKCTNIQIIGVPEEEEKICEETMVENSLIWERKYLIKSRKHRESQKGLIQEETCQDIY